MPKFRIIPFWNHLGKKVATLLQTCHYILDRPDLSSTKSEVLRQPNSEHNGLRKYLLERVSGCGFFGFRNTR